MDFLRELGATLLDTYYGWRDARAPLLAAAIAYHALFAMAPLAVVAVGVAGLVFGEAAARGEVADYFSGVLGGEGAQVVEGLVESASVGGAGVLATAAGGALMLFGSVRAFLQVQNALNALWGVRIKPGTPRWKALLPKLLPFTLVLASVFGLVALMLFDRAAAWLAARDLAPELGVAGLSVGRTLLALAMAYAALAFVFKYLPDVRVEWRDVRLGAALTLGLLALATWVLGAYFSWSGSATVSGIAGGLVAILLWVYYSAQILLLGAEFTRVHARRRGAPILPAPYAVRTRRVVDEELSKSSQPHV
jgi:membrane protein